jgi:hypothetical protein
VFKDAIASCFITTGDTAGLSLNGIVAEKKLGTGY